MYITVRRYAGAGRHVTEIARRVQDDLVPKLGAMPGFKGYCVFGSEDGSVTSVSLFDDRQSAMTASDTSRRWVREKLGDLQLGSPEISSGVCSIHEMAKRQTGPGGPLYVVVRQYDGAGPEPRILELARQHVTPLITGSPGFRGYHLFRHETEQGRMSSVTLFASREEAMRAHEQVVALVREKMPDVVPNPPRVLAGQTVVLASAAADRTPEA